MRFEDFLVRENFLTKEEYLLLVWNCVKGLNGQRDNDGFLKPNFAGCKGIDDLLPVPVGTKLDDLRFLAIKREIFNRSKTKCLADLIKLWREFHVKNLLPISDYSLTSTFGSDLYKNVTEKKACARFVAERDRLVHNGDHVIIPEGTSTFYVGLAIGAYRRNITFITSNGPLIREFCENPVLASSASNVFVIGGELDADATTRTVASRGFVGPQTEEGYGSCMTKPGATVLICSANGLLPKIGPFAPTEPSPKSGATRYGLLKAVMEPNRGQPIRQVVFVVDYTKVLANKRADYGEPVFPDAREWQHFMELHRSRISFVVAAPRELALVPDYCRLLPRERPLHGLAQQVDFPDVREYARSAHALDLESAGSDLESRFYEVFEDSVSVPHLAVPV